MTRRPRIAVLVVTAALVALPVPPAAAHCDTLDGPVVQAARLALEKGDLRPVLKWVRAADEDEVRGVFDQAMAVRESGGQARMLADRYFFETVVRIHRNGEGAPYTGLKPAGAVEPAIAAADRAVDSGSAVALVARTQAELAEGLEARFERLMEAKQHSEESVQAGRDFVAAYVDFIHYVEAVHEALRGKSHVHE